MVNVRVPVVALLPTFTDKVELPDPVTEVGFSVVVTREPCPVTLRVTVPVNPFSDPMVTFELPVEPRATVMLAGASAMVKSAGAEEFTVKAMVVVCVMPPPLAVMVTFAVPRAAAPLAVKVMVELPLPGAGMGAGLKTAVTPEGRPETVRLIAELNPPPTVVVMVLVAVLPCVTLTEAGDAARVKAGVAACQTSVMGVALAAAPACVSP